MNVGGRAARTFAAGRHRAAFEPGTHVRTCVMRGHTYPSPTRHPDLAFIMAAVLRLAAPARRRRRRRLAVGAGARRRPSGKRRRTIPRNEGVR